MEEINQQDETRKFYCAIDKIKRSFQPKMYACKNKDGPS